MGIVSGAGSVLGICLMLLNLLGGIVGAVWLGIDGEWGLIGRGLLLGFLAMFAIGVAMVPGLFMFGAPAIAMANRGWKIPYVFFMSLSLLYSSAVVSLYALWILFDFVALEDPSQLVPRMLWAYAVATGPVVALAEKDMRSGNDAALVPAFFLQVAFIIAALAGALLGITILGVVVVFCVIMLACWILQLFMHVPPALHEIKLKALGMNW